MKTIALFVLSCGVYGFLFAAEVIPSPVAITVKATIVGPEESKPGTSVVLSGATSIGTNHRWIYDKDYGFGVFTCNEKRELGFATTTEGVYKFWLVVSDANGVLDVAVHSVVIKSGGAPLPSQLDKKLAKALEVVVANAVSRAVVLNDPSTLKNLVAQWKAASGGIRGSPSLEEAGKVSGQAFEVAMAKRTGLSRYKDWEKAFRRPLNADLGKLVNDGLVKTPAQFDQCIQAIAEKLDVEAAQKTSSLSPTLKQQLENATPGQVIRVSGYHLVDNIRWDVPVKLIGDGTAVLNGRGAKRALRYTGGGSLLIEGIKFVGYQRAIELLPKDAQRIQIVDCEFEGCGTAVYGGTNDERTVRCDDIELSDLYVYGCTGRAVDIYTPFKSCRVRNSVIDGGGQGAVWLGWSKVGNRYYGFASVSNCVIRNIHAKHDCKAVMLATRVGVVSKNHFTDIGTTEESGHASDTCSAYFKCDRALVSHNTFDRACGVVGKQSCNLIVNGNLFWTDLKPVGIYRNQVRAITTTKKAIVNAYGNRIWGMVIGLASQRRSFVRDNFLSDVPLYKPWGFNQRVAVFYESATPDFHEIGDNEVDNGVLEVYRRNG